MRTSFQDLSVLEISRLRGVARSTVSYWISKKGLPAGRSGKKHVVALDDLMLFLKVHGYEFPEFLRENRGTLLDHPQHAVIKCWEYWSQKSRWKRCTECNVFTQQITECFTAKLNRTRECRPKCHECQYYGEYYEPQVRFIYQIEKPSAIQKDLTLWAGNHSWAELFEIPDKCLIGTGIEEFVHPDSLKMILSYSKRRNNGDTTVPDHYQALIINKQGEKFRVNMLISPLRNPPGTWLAVIENVRFISRGL